MSSNPALAPDPVSALPGEADAVALREAVRARHSVRTYDGEPLTPAHLEFLNAYLEDSQRLVGPLGREFRIVLLRDVAKDKQIGTYGYTKGYDGILVAIAPSDPLSLFELAFVLHGLVLQMTHNGVDTVWMGGSFSRKSIEKSVALAPGEIIGAMVAFGYGSGHRRFIDIAMPLVVKPALRKPVEHFYFIGDFSRPLHEESAAKTLFAALDLARRAPSAKNKQSWRAVVSEDETRVDIYAAFSLRGEVGTGFRQYACPPEYLDVGTWARGFVVALAAENIRGHFLVDDPHITLPASADMEYLATWMRHQ